MDTKTIARLREQWKHDIGECKNEDALKAVDILYLGRKSGKVTELLHSLKDMSIDQRKEFGPLIQQLKQEVEKGMNDQRQKFSARSSQLEAREDVTLPGIAPKQGHYSPLTKTLRDIEEIFRSMGFMVLDGPQLESEHYNFDVLNIPSWHPAREMWDTFYVEDPQAPELSKKHRLLLRTHTSSLQVRVMENYPLPIRAIMPGVVFRNEATDARHEKAFLNVEGLMIAKDISVQHLISVSRVFVKKILGEKVELRFRPGYFPFTEPSLELDISCLICQQKGCPVCKKTGWLEFMGAGMVHPNVLKSGGIDPKKYSGFAFGFGLDRLVMLRYGIDDVRLFRSQDLRFIEQF